MKKNYLFPNKYKRVGWYLLSVFTICGLLYLLGVIPENLLTTKMKTIPITGPLMFGKNDWMDEIITIGLGLSLLLVGFSKEKDEDELITEIRMYSIAFATKLTISMVLLATLLLFDLAFFYFMIFNLFLLMYIFIFKFEYELRKFRKENKEVGV